MQSSRETRGVKVALVGAPHAGKAAVAYHLCAKHGGTPLRSQPVGGAHLVIGELAWPEAPADGEQLRVDLHTVYGAPDHRGITRLLLQGCDGIVFLADTHPDRIALAPGQLRAFLDDCAVAGVDWEKTVAALQYHRIETCPGFRADVMTHFLQIPEGQLECFATTFDPGDDSGAAIEWVIRKIAQKQRLQEAATA